MKKQKIRIAMRAALALIIVMMLSSLATSEEEGEQVLRRTRDGNVVKTGCDELDSFITNLSDFTTKIVNMFYDGKKETKKVNTGDEEDSDGLVHLDLLPISKDR